MVGAEGFEPPTLCSQSRCATRLRYAPITSFDCNPNGIRFGSLNRANKQGMTGQAATRRDPSDLPLRRWPAERKSEKTLTGCAQLRPFADSIKRYASMLQSIG